MKTTKKSFATFYSPGTFVAETSIVELPSADPKAATLEAEWKAP